MPFDNLMNYLGKNPQDDPDFQKQLQGYQNNPQQAQQDAGAAMQDQSNMMSNPQMQGPQLGPQVTLPSQQAMINGPVQAPKAPMSLPMQAAQWAVGNQTSPGDAIQESHPENFIPIDAMGSMGMNALEMGGKAVGEAGAEAAGRDITENTIANAGANEASLSKLASLNAAKKADQAAAGRVAGTASESNPTSTINYKDMLKQYVQQRNKMTKQQNGQGSQGQ